MLGLNLRSEPQMCVCGQKSREPQGPTHLPHTALLRIDSCVCQAAGAGLACRGYSEPYLVMPLA